MSQIEFEPIVDPYEFEDRSNRFRDDVITLSRDFPDLLIGTENKSLRELDASAWACKISAEHKNIKMFEKAFARGKEREINSATETTVQISIHGTITSEINRFKGLVEKCANQYGGKKTDEDRNSYPEAPEGGFRFYSFVDYTFRG